MRLPFVLIKIYHRGVISDKSGPINERSAPSAAFQHSFICLFYLLVVPKELTDFLKRSYRYGFTNHVFEVQELLNSAMRDLLTKIQPPGHCLYPLLPPKRGRSNRHRPKGHDYELPNCTYNFHKQSYVINCLFRFLYWFYIACIHTVLCVYVCYMLLINTLT